MMKEDIDIIPEQFKSLFAAMNNRVVALTEENNRLRRALFWAKSEQHHVGEFIEPKGTLFNEPEAILELEQKAEETPTVTQQQKMRSPNSGGRKAFPENLPRTRVICDIPENEKVCPHDGSPLVEMGERIVETLEVEPMKASVTQHVYKKYGCACCKEHVKEAPAVPSILPRTTCGPSTLAAIINQKYFLGLPLYRIEQAFTQLGVEVPRTSMARWIIAAADVLGDLVYEIRRYIFELDVIHCDESVVQVLKESGKTPQSQSYMWVACSSINAHPAVWFEYSPDRTQKSAQQLLGSFSGLLHVDGYAGYDSAIQRNGIIRIGCWAHARRKFDVAKKDGAASGKTLAAQFLDDMQKLFLLERDFKELLPDDKVHMRQKHSKPIVEEIKNRLDEFRPQVPPKSKLGEAFTYLANQWESLLVFLEHGKAELSNNRIENHIRPFAIGRKNWLFSATEKGADASALLYSLVCTAKANHVDVFDYLNYLCCELPKVYAAKEKKPDLTPFLPWNFKSTS